MEGLAMNELDLMPTIPDEASFITEEKLAAIIDE